MLCQWSEVWARGKCYWQLCPVADAYNHSRFSQVPMIFVNDLIIMIRLCMMLELLPCMWFFLFNSLKSLPMQWFIVYV